MFRWQMPKLDLRDQYARRRGVTGQALGWRTRNELERFTGMANSVEAVGLRSRHQGRRFSPPNTPLSAKDGGWFVRRVTARWLKWLLEIHERVESCDPD
jgi:hypothetical protein